MNFKVIFFSICFLLIAKNTLAQTGSKPICLNHSLLILDSTTYQAAVNSDFVQKLAFSYEKKLIGYQGFYLMGKTNYLEIFHPKSFQGAIYDPGTIWVCLASLQANYLLELNSDSSDAIVYHSDPNYNSFSLTFEEDTVLTTWEMKQTYYESWTKKKYNDTMAFLPVDYNSPQDADSSSNYLMDDLKGIGLSLHPKDSLALANYLNEIGYSSITTFNGNTRFSSRDQFFELHTSEDNNRMTINRYYIGLNRAVEKRIETIGNSRIECAGTTAVWIFDPPNKY